MSHLSFLRASDPLTLAAAAAESGAHLPGGADPSLVLRGAAPLGRAGRDEVAAFHDGIGFDELAATRAGACFVAPRHLDRVPAGTVALVTDHPRDAFAALAAMLHPGCLRPYSVVANQGIDPGARVHAGALIERGAVIDPGAIIGPGAEIGAGTFIGALTVVGAGVRIGRDCAIDAQVSLAHALVGDRVLIHPGARIGQGGRALRLGRVIIQDDVEIGANAAIARGELTDTVIGEGSRIAALATVAGRYKTARIAARPPPPPPPPPGAANTGLTGSSQPHASDSEIVLSTTRMNRIREIDLDNDTITVEAGSITARNASLAAPRTRAAT